MRIGVDVDGVLNHLHVDWTWWYNHEFASQGNLVDPTEWASWDFAGFPGDECSRDEFYGFLTPGLYYDDGTLPIPGAADELRVIRSIGHAITFVTACGNNNRLAAAKLDWLLRHGLFQEGDLYRPASDKADASVDILLDDAIHNVQAFHSQGGFKMGVLVNAPHNSNDEWFPRVEGLTASAVLGAIDRLHTERVRHG